jgi:hypothetical protein
MIVTTRLVGSREKDEELGFRKSGLRHASGILFVGSDGKV